MDKDYNNKNYLERNKILLGLHREYTKRHIIPMKWLSIKSYLRLLIKKKRKKVLPRCFLMPFKPHLLLLNTISLILYFLLIIDVT
jgi:hypothetical protein